MSRQWRDILPYLVEGTRSCECSCSDIVGGKSLDPRLRGDVEKHRDCQSEESRLCETTKNLYCIAI
jgi:hypothetical protein